MQESVYLHGNSQGRQRIRLDKEVSARPGVSKVPGDPAKDSGRITKNLQEDDFQAYQRREKDKDISDEQKVSVQTDLVRREGLSS